MAYVKGNDLKKDLLRLYFRAEAVAPATFYVGLGVGSLPTETAALTDIVEVAGTGYARAALVRGTVDFGAPTVASSIATIQSVLKNFAATGNWTKADYVFLADVVSGTAGKFLAAASLDEPFRLLGGEDVNIGVDPQLT